MAPQDSLATELKQIHSAEKRLMRALPKLRKQVSSPHLQQILDRRREQGGQALEQLDDVFEEMQTRSGRAKNLAAEGLLEDMLQHVDDIADDAVLLGSMQKIEHYCTAAWGTVGAMGRMIGQRSAVRAMERLLSDGKRFDSELTMLAGEEINPAMLDAEDEGRQTGRAQGRSRARQPAH